MGKRQFQKKASQVARSSLLSATGNGIQKKLPNGAANTNVTCVHRGRKRRQEAREREERKRAFIEAELTKLEVIATEKRKALTKRNNRKKGSATFKTLHVDLATALNQLDDDRQTPQDSPLKENEQRLKKQLRHRNWANVVNEERSQMERVTQHDAFVGMGVEALRAHLTNTVMSAPTTASPKEKEPRKQPTKPAALVNKRTKTTEQGDDAESVAAQRREFKKRQAEQVLRMGAKKRGDVKRQTFGSLLGGVKADKYSAEGRGRIGDKRPKNLT